jgi:hypothetical protein
MHTSEQKKISFFQNIKNWGKNIKWGMQHNLGSGEVCPCHINKFFTMSGVRKEGT